MLLASGLALARWVSGGCKYRGLRERGKFLIGVAAVVTLIGVAGCDDVSDRSSNHSQYKPEKVANAGLSKEEKDQANGSRSSGTRSTGRALQRPSIPPVASHRVASQTSSQKTTPGQRQKPTTRL